MLNQNSTPIFIINLAKSVERRERINAQFQLLLDQHPESAMNYQFFPAVYGKENPDHPLFKKYNQQKRFLRKGNYFNLSQLGCYASHYLLWEKCVELNQPIIVLEDDAILNKNFLTIYQFINSQNNHFEFFWLSPPAPPRRNQLGKTLFQINPENSVKQYYKDWGNATGYYLTPSAAKKFLKQSEEWIYDVDITMERYWENKVQYCAVFPACVEPDFYLESNIPVDKGRQHRTLGVKCHREFYKFLDKIHKFLFDCQNK